MTFDCSYFRDLEKIVKIKRGSPYSSRYQRQGSESREHIECVWMKDVEKM